jgi:hypothetical protein
MLEKLVVNKEGSKQRMRKGRERNKEEKQVDPIEKWLDPVSRMEDIKYPKQLLYYRPIERRRPGRSLDY